jgi:hypothetical protein
MANVMFPQILASNASRMPIARKEHATKPPDSALVARKTVIAPMAKFVKTIFAMPVPTTMTVLVGRCAYKANVSQAVATETRIVQAAKYAKRTCVSLVPKIESVSTRSCVLQGAAKQMHAVRAVIA